MSPQLKQTKCKDQLQMDGRLWIISLGQFELEISVVFDVLEIQSQQKLNT